jgi:diaminohydroxyphosphoribosylaminopyrimidine deaminase/5-amino-6-(5-phosphoribosylamino)uracil reductase
VARVVASRADPFPQVAGQGVAVLRNHGVAVDVGLLESEATRLNAPYLTLIGKRRPYVHAKWAMTLDGKIAASSGQSKWISGEASRRRVHQLRGRMDAIIVGANTVRTDNPLLTARPPGPRVPARIVLSSTGTLSAECQLLQTIDQAPVIVTGPTGRKAGGYELLAVPLAAGRASVVALLAELGRRRLTNVLVEGGAETLGSFIDMRLVDELHVFIAPRLLGDGKPAVSIRGATGIHVGWTIGRWQSEHVGEDLYVHGWWDSAVRRG